MTPLLSPRGGGGGGEFKEHTNHMTYLLHCQLNTANLAFNTDVTTGFSIVY